MSQLDAQGEAHGALGSVVAGYGQGVLSDPHMLGNLVTDLLPDSSTLALQLNGRS